MMRRSFRQCAQGDTKKIFGRNVLGSNELKKLLNTQEFLEYKSSLATGKQLSKPLANKIAKNVFEWAAERGVQRYAHVFNPVCRHPAFKYNTFFNLDFKSEDWTVPLDFLESWTGGLMLYSETDGSSFPAGGLRVTHQAAAYLSWDKASPMYIKDGTLFIPSSSVTFNGDANDEKTPLLRSVKAIDKETTRLLHLLGYKDVKSVVANVGCEQEFYLLNRELFLQRPDLINCGRTLIGSPGANNQQLSDNYFAEPSKRVQNFFDDLQFRALELGISFTVGHNEVGPSQHEWSPQFTLANIAADQNNLAMQLMNDLAQKHGLVCLIHEKPYKGVNGSGKHNNWGLNTDTGKNLYVAGSNPQDQRMFTAMIATLARAIFNYGDLLRLGVATPNNDHRLGAHEAPPAIMSMYLGQGLTDFIKKASEGGPLTGYAQADRTVDTGTLSVGQVPTQSEDRNRTAPFPWCGNRFEFRAVGSSQNVSWPLTLLQAIVADSCRELADQIEKTGDVDNSIRKMLKENMGSIFVGDGYSEEWHAEAKKRGLCNLKDTPSAIDVLSVQKNRDLLNRMKIFSEKEVAARQEMLYSHYATVVEIEAQTMVKMIQRGVLPAAAKDLNESNANLGRSEKEAIYQNLYKQNNALKEVLKKNNNPDPRETAHFVKNQVKPAMEALRKAADQAEEVISSEHYPFPTYSDLWYSHHWDHHKAHKTS